MPLDLDEARDLLGCTGRTHPARERALEELHRDARGNPGQLLRLAQSRPELARPGSDRDERRVALAQRRLHTAGPNRPAEPRVFDDIEPVSDPGAATEGVGPARIDAPSLVPTRPPIRDEDGLVEVGWEGDLESDLVPAGGSSPAPGLSPTDDASFNEELIEDRYAALQAWAEWTRNQGRSAGENPASQSVPAGRPPEDSSRAEETGGALLTTALDAAAPRDRASAADAPAALPQASVRAESQHEFAPYSHLFSRIRQSRHPGP
jgi:general secretion pathway protein A